MVEGASWLAEPEVEVRQLVAGYNSGPPVLDGLSLTASAGEVVAVLGRNGAGKTTLLRCISGLLRPRSGGVRLGGADVTGSAPHAIAGRGVAHVPEGRRVIPNMSVLDNLKLGGYRFRRRADLERRLEIVGSYFPSLLGWAKRRAGTLSGGQQQLLSIGRGLMSNPSVLLLDEPLTGLDPIFQREVISALDRIRTSGLAIVLVEQNARRSLDLADRALVIDSGRVVLSGPAAELKENTGVQEGYLGVRVEGAHSTTQRQLEGNDS